MSFHLLENDYGIDHIELFNIIINFITNYSNLNDVDIEEFEYSEKVSKVNLDYVLIEKYNFYKQKISTEKSKIPQYKIEIRGNNREEILKK